MLGATLIGAFGGRAVGGGGPISISMLATPTLGNSVTSTVSTGSLSPTGDALILVGFMHRGGPAARTHNAPTAAFATTGAFTSLVEVAINDALEDATSNKLRISIWGAVATASPGTGAVTCTSSDTTFQQIVAVAQVINRLSATPFATARDWAFSGTDVSDDLSPTTTATYGAGFALGCQNGTTGTPDFSTPFVDIASSPFTTGDFEGAVATLTGTPGSNTVATTGGQSGRAKGVAAVFFNGLSA